MWHSSGTVLGKAPIHGARSAVVRGRERKDPTMSTQLEGYTRGNRVGIGWGIVWFVEVLNKQKHPKHIMF